MQPDVHQGPIPIPCPILELEIGNVIEEIQRTSSPAAQQQLDKQLYSLNQLYEKQCEGKPVTRRSSAIGLSGTMRFQNGSLSLTVVNETGNVVTVLYGGNDGVLITLDGQGHIHVLPPEGAGDPEVRQAVTAALQTINLLAAAAGANLATAGA
jgi:hypothetical protein